MPTPSALEICRTDFVTKEVELQERYPQVIVDMVLRIREMYNWFISNPDGTDREFVAELCQRHGISKVTAYADLAIVKTLLPTLATAKLFSPPKFKTRKTPKAISSNPKIIRNFALNYCN